MSLKKILITAFVFVSVISLLSRCNILNTNKSWAVDKACTEVESYIYKEYGEIPSTNGKIIYNKDNHYIVAVKFDLRDLDWQGSVACNVYGYRKSNCFLSGMTKEMSYDFKYENQINELKALWSLD